MYYFRKIILVACLFLALFAMGRSAFAAGNIDSVQKYSQYLNLDLDNSGQNDFINWDPTLGGATVTDTALTGYIWDGDGGYINLNPSQAGVANSCTGILGGYAWDEGAGWINFDPTMATGSLGGENNQPSINTTTGQITGTVWSQNYGWIQLSALQAPTGDPYVPYNSGNPSSGLITSWRPSNTCSNNPINGVCGAANGVTTSSQPTSLCNAGTPTVPVSTGTSWLWQCGGTGGGNTVSCGAPEDQQCVGGSCSHGGGTSPTLIIITHVVGGTDTAANFTVHVIQQGSSELAGSPASGVESGRSYPAAGGTSYVVSEDVLSGYTTTFSGDCDPSGIVSFPQYSTATETCQITDTSTISSPDLCPNIPGVQASVPSGDIINGNGDCVPVSQTDLCPNLPGVQTVIPIGYSLDGNGDCVQPPYTDVCPNIPGLQTSIPAGDIIDTNGDCVPSSLSDLCPNIPGVQTSIPFGYTVDSNGNCVIATTPPVGPGDRVSGVQSGIGPGSPLGGNFPQSGSLKHSWLWPVVALMGLLASTPAVFSRLVNIFLTFIFDRKKQRGIVYDSKTKEPLDPAYISVIDVTTGKEVTNQITDLEGRYGFLLKKGSYKLIANKTHYQFPSVLLAGHTSDPVYDNLYFGDVFTVTDEDQVVNMNIPMDPLDVDWNQQEKRRMNPLRYLIENQKALAWFFELLFILGFVVSIIITYFYPIWWNILMSILYIVIGAFQVFGHGAVSSGRVTKDGVPLANAIIRVYNANLNHEVAHKVTNERGSYYILVPRASYYVTIEQKNADGTYTHIFTSTVMKVGNGVIDKSFDL